MLVSTGGPHWLVVPDDRFADTADSALLDLKYLNVHFGAIVALSDAVNNNMKVVGHSLSVVYARKPHCVVYIAQRSNHFYRGRNTYRNPNPQLTHGKMYQINRKYVKKWI